MVMAHLPRCPQAQGLKPPLPPVTRHASPSPRQRRQQHGGRHVRAQAAGKRVMLELGPFYLPKVCFQECLHTDWPGSPN